MAEWRRVQTQFWNDAEVLDFTPEDRLFYLYLLTNPSTTACGVYELHPKQAVMHTGYNSETIISLIKRFIEKGKIRYNEQTKEVLVLRWFHYNSPISPKVRPLVLKELKQVKTDSFRLYVLEELKAKLKEAWAETPTKDTAVKKDQERVLAQLEALIQNESGSDTVSHTVSLAPDTVAVDVDREEDIDKDLEDLKVFHAERGNNFPPARRHDEPQDQTEEAQLAATEEAVREAPPQNDAGVVVPPLSEKDWLDLKFDDFEHDGHRLHHLVNLFDHYAPRWWLQLTRSANKAEENKRKHYILMRLHGAASSHPPSAFGFLAHVAKQKISPPLPEKIGNAYAVVNGWLVSKNGEFSSWIRQEYKRWVDETKNAEIAKRLGLPAECVYATEVF